MGSVGVRKVRIATRRSRLAIVQAEFVAARLREFGPDLEVELVGLTTKGDQDLSPSLVAAGGKSSFVSALEDALLEGRADLAVHSMKDVAASVQPCFTLHTFGPRADVRDALVVRGSGAGGSLGDLAHGARVGTSSIRRGALLSALRRDLHIVPVRGNVDTRLKRLDDGGYDALLLACAGLDRLGLSGRISQRIDPGVLVPAPGQGALAVQFLADRRDLAEMAGNAVDAHVESCVTAERQLTRRLGADCAMPFGAYCSKAEDQLRLTATVADPDGTRVLRVELLGDEPAALGDEAAERLGVLGVRELLDSL